METTTMTTTMTRKTTLLSHAAFQAIGRFLVKRAVVGALLVVISALGSFLGVVEKKAPAASRPAVVATAAPMSTARAGVTGPFLAGDVLLTADGGAVKVLVIEEGAVHVRVYAGSFASADALREAMAKKTLRMAIGHLPLTPDAFDGAVVVASEPVTADDLVGYQFYRQLSK